MLVGMAPEPATRAETPEQPAVTGLTSEEAALRLRARGSLEHAASSRSYASIVRANVLTVFNLILAVFGALTLSFGDVAGRALPRRSSSRTRRSGSPRRCARRRRSTASRRSSRRRRPSSATARRTGCRVEDVVVGDLVLLEPGDQLVADGPRRGGRGTARWTSRSSPASREQRRPRRRRRGALRLVRARGHRRATRSTAVGKESYAARVAGEARAFRHPRSPLERALNRLLYVLVAVDGAARLAPRRTRCGSATRPSARRSRPPSPAVVTLVPEGLILLSASTFAVAALRMARRGALAQQLNAIESLASVDVICLDKTGTLTEADAARRRCRAAHRASTRSGSPRRSARFAASRRCRNTTLDARSREAFHAARRAPDGEVPFSSRRRWSALRLGGVTLRPRRPRAVPARRRWPSASATRRAAAAACSRSRGRRRRSTREPSDRPAGRARAARRSSCSPSGCARTQRETVAFFHAQGVELKVLSGDRPETVARDRA